MTRDWLGQAKALWPVGVVTILAGYLVWRPLDDLFINSSTPGTWGLYAWHVRHVAVIEGGLELILLFLLLLGGATLARRKVVFYVALGLPVLLYLRRHHVDLPFFVGLLYLEAIFGFGLAITRRFKQTTTHTAHDCVIYFLTGVIFWALCILAASVLGLGTPGHLRWLAVGLGGVVIGLNRFDLLSVRLARTAWTWGKLERSLILYLAILVLYLFAKSNFSVDADSIWYGLRGEYILTGEHSFFDNLGLVTFVFYYPKLFELLLLPLSGLGDYSFLYAVTIFCYVVLLLVAYDFLRVLRVGRLHALFGVALVGSLPVVSNMAETAKPDIFATLLMLIAATSLWHALRSGCQTPLLYAVSSLMLAFGSKLISFPFGGLLLFGVGGASLWIKRKRSSFPWNETEKQRDVSPLLGWVCLSGGLIVLLGVTYRTYLLTGMPVVGPGMLVQLLERVGFEGRYPVGLMPSSLAGSHGRAPGQVLLEYLLTPSRLPHVVFVWTGNITFFLFCALALRIRTNLVSAVSQWRLVVLYVPVLLAGLYLAATYGHGGLPGSDGNYFMFPVVLATLIFYAIVIGSSEHSPRGPYLTAVLSGLSVLLLFQTLVGFVTAPGWHPGTRQWDLEFAASPFDTESYNARQLGYHGLLEIESYFKEHEGQAGGCRAVGVGNEYVMNFLSCRYESDMIMKWYQPGLFASLDAFREYMNFAEINYLIVPLPPLHREDVVGQAYEMLKTVPGARVVEGTLYTMLDLREVEKPFLFGGGQARANPREVRVIDFVSALDQARSEGVTDGNRGWGKTVSANPPASPSPGAGAMVLRSGTGLEYSVTLPAVFPSTMKLIMGRHPEEIVKDRVGARLRIEVMEHESGEAIVSEVISCPEGYQGVALSLERAIGETVQVRLSAERQSTETPEDIWGEWVYLIDPRIVYEVVSEEDDPVGGRRRRRARSGGAERAES